MVDTAASEQIQSDNNQSGRNEDVEVVVGKDVGSVPGSFWVAEEDAKLLKLKAEGLGNSEISKKLNRTVNTVKTRVNILASAEQKESRKRVPWYYTGMVTTALLLLPERRELFLRCDKSSSRSLQRNLTGEGNSIGDSCPVGRRK